MATVEEHIPAHQSKTHRTEPESASASATTRYNPDLAEFERSGSKEKPAFMLTKSEFKLLGIAGPVATMLQYRLYGGHSLPANLEGFMKAGANIGSVIGQFLFGYLADALGRKAIYGKELMLIIFATILTLTTPTGSLSPDSCLIYLGVIRIVLGIGVGGDYPMSASVTSDRANLRKRGTMLAYIFSNQGWGSLLGSVVTIVVLACYKHVMDVEGKTSKVDGVWRIVVGVSLIPAFGTLYQRLTLPESTRFIASQKLKNATSAAEEGDAVAAIKKAQVAGQATTWDSEKSGNSSEDNVKDTDSKRLSQTSEHTVDGDPESPANAKKSHFRGTFYGINLNQNVVLQQIGYDGKSGTAWHRMFKISTGNIIITALGFVPGAPFSPPPLEALLGIGLHDRDYGPQVDTDSGVPARRALPYVPSLPPFPFPYSRLNDLGTVAVLAGKFTELSTAGFIFFFNWGANTTAYCYPAEVFPTRYRASAHGLSAAAGKAGAIISALAFNTLTKKIGTPAVLWTGAAFTLLLPEVKGRDPDLVLAEEMRAAREERERLPR
ncbi:hypothetical protein C0995_001583 [Termitomyces sp. Mi166|nr:hypothetical protein C0995_001583 [Termitomyces sp. Mi166\